MCVCVYAWVGLFTFYKKWPADLVGQTCRQLKGRIAEGKGKENSLPDDRNVLSKLERDSTIAVHGTAEGHTIECD